MLTAIRSLFSSRTATPRAPSPEVVEYGKNPACLEAVEATNRIVFDALPREPQVNPALKEQRSILENAGLEWQVRYTEHQIRLDACRSLGLSVYDDVGAAELLAGVKVKATRLSGWLESRVASSRVRNEVDRRDVSSRISGILAGERIIDENRVVYDAFRAFDVPKNEKLVIGDLDDLRYPISVGAVLRMQVAKDIKVLGAPLFNGFAIVAPESCWASPEKKDPLLLGVILGPIDRKERCFQDRFALLARWE